MLLRKPLRVLALAGVVALAAAFAVPALAVHSRTVKVGDFFFLKDTNHTPTVHVAKGTLVKWKFVGSVDHNVTVENGPVKFHSKDMSSGIYKKKVSKAGTYLIECTIHGFKMRLVVGKPTQGDVQPKPNPAPAPPAPNPYPGY
jgi:plastocyanin